MKECYLELAGLRAVLRTPQTVAISQRLRPFLVPAHTQTDCVITVQPTAALPAPSEAGIWHGQEYYDSYAGAMRVFHCSAADGEAFALTRHLESGDVEISVLPEYLSWFAGSSGIFNRIGMETLLLQHRGVLLHASFIDFCGKGIAFTGPSGVGKSTQAELWQRHMGARIINGDRVALRRLPGGWIGYGSPYAGSSGIYRRESAPLAAVVVLRQAEENRLRRLSGAEALRYVYPELTLHRWDKNFVAAATDLCLELLEATPVYLLECLPEEAAVRLLQKGIFP